jgi:hypothetical protein
MLSKFLFSIKRELYGFYKNTNTACENQQTQKQENENECDLPKITIQQTERSLD